MLGKDALVSTFTGRELSLGEIYREHSVDTPYIKKNYRETLLALEEDGDIDAYSVKGKRRKGTYPEHVRIRFPKGRSHGQ